MKLIDRQTGFLCIIQGDGGGLTPGERAYHFAYRSRLTEALGKIYEQTWAWLGDEAFQTAAAAYVQAHPPASWTLDAYGERFPDVLADAYPHNPEVGELAWLDAAWQQVFTARDVPPLGPARLTGADWATARLVVTPVLRLRPATTNAASIWFALSRDETPPPVERLDDGGMAVWRQGLEVNIRACDRDDYAALLQLAAGEPFADLCQSLLGDRTPDEATAQAAAWLGQWIADGLVCDIG